MARAVLQNIVLEMVTTALQTAIPRRAPIVEHAPNAMAADPVLQIRHNTQIVDLAKNAPAKESAATKAAAKISKGNVHQTLVVAPVTATAQVRAITPVAAPTVVHAPHVMDPEVATMTPASILTVAPAKSVVAKVPAPTSQALKTSRINAHQRLAVERATVTAVAPAVTPLQAQTAAYAHHATGVVGALPTSISMQIAENVNIAPAKDSADSKAHSSISKMNARIRSALPVCAMVLAVVPMTTMAVAVTQTATVVLSLTAATTAPAHPARKPRVMTVNTARMTAAPVHRVIVTAAPTP